MFFIILVICIAVFVLFQKLFKDASSQFNKERDIFIKYLDSKNDLETLKRIGEINMFGVREKWYPRYTNVIPYLEKKIAETNDENFIMYLFAYERFIKKFLLTMPFIVLSIIIPIAYIVFIFRK